MTRQWRTVFGGAALGVALVCTVASAVTGQTVRKTRVGASYLSVFGGGSYASGSTSPTTGANLGVEITPRISLEGGGRWLSVPAGQEAYATDLGVRYTVGARTFVVPYLSAGAGVFDAYYPSVTTSTPSFYRQRMDSNGAAHAFRDPAWTCGAGADLFANGHLSLRPAVSVLIVTTRHDARVVPVYGIHLAYFFESHTSVSRQH